MPHDDFFEKTLFEFTQWTQGKEKSIAKFSNSEDLPSNLINILKSKSESTIFLNKKKWKILEITSDIRSHGEGIHVKVRLEPYNANN